DLNGFTLLVLANTLVMAVRERTRELAVLQALGFTSRHLISLVAGEALLIGGLGAGLGILVTIPANHLFAALIAGKLGNLFQHMHLYPSTLLLSALATFSIAVCASAVPVAVVLRAKVAQGLRYLG